MRIPRSYLFVPADRPERYAKALASGGDVVIVDLEDAVAPADKDAAREALASWLATSDSDAKVVVRINGVDTPWYEADRVLVTGSPRVSTVMLPKADGRSPWTAFEGKPTLALVETAAGIDALRVIAGAPGVRRLAFGSIDLQLDLGVEGDDDALLCISVRNSSWRHALPTCLLRSMVCARRSMMRRPLPCTSSVPAD